MPTEGLSEENLALLEREGWSTGNLSPEMQAEFNYLLDAARAEGPAPPGGDWRDIESAPRDGTEVLLICASAYSPTASAGWWSDGAGGKGWRHYSRPADKWSGGVHLWFPTHWQPLPTFTKGADRG